MMNQCLIANALSGRIERSHHGRFSKFESMRPFLQTQDLLCDRPDISLYPRLYFWKAVTSSQLSILLMVGED